MAKEIKGNEDVDVYFTIDNVLHNIGGKRNIFSNLRSGFYSVWCINDVAFYMEFTHDYGFNYVFINEE